MSNLTPKQEKFCRNIVNGMSQVDAYRNSYNCKNSKSNTMHTKASVMMRQDKIRARISELRDRLEKKDLWKREDSVKTLIEVIQKDFDAKPTDKIRAVAELNKMHGWQSSTVDLTNSDKSLERKTINHFYANSASDS